MRYALLFLIATISLPTIVLAADVQSIDTGSGMKHPPVLTGAMLEQRALHMAMESLSESDRAELAKLIRTHLEGKGVKIPTADQVNQIRQENKEDKQEVRKDIKDTRSTLQKKLTEQKEQMKDMKKGEKQEMKKQIQNQKSEFRADAQKKRQDMRMRIDDRRTNAATATGVVITGTVAQ